MSTPIRREIQIRFRLDPKSGQPIGQPLSGKNVDQSDENSIDSVNFVFGTTDACGCDGGKPRGGECAVCRESVCVDCFEKSRCRFCRKPLCPEHAIFVVKDDGSDIPLCDRCSRAFTRKRTARKLVQGLLAPFVTFDEESDA